MNAGGLDSCCKVLLVHVKKEKQEAFLSSSSAVMCMQETRQFKRRTSESSREHVAQIQMDRQSREAWTERG